MFLVVRSWGVKMSSDKIYPLAQHTQRYFRELAILECPDKKADFEGAEAFFDTDKTKDILKESGFSDGEISLLYSTAESKAKENRENAPKKRNKEDEEAIETSLIVDEKNNIFAEQIYTDKKTMFCLYDKGSDQVTYSNILEIQGITYKPIHAEEVFKKAVKLPTKAEEYGSDEELDNEIRRFIQKWLDIPDDFLQFALWNIKRSWVFEKFHTLNYLRALGDTGQGKTRFLDALGYIHYKPIATSGATTSAPVFRIIQKWQGTLIMDEADLKHSDESQDMIKIINQGYEKGKYVMRCDQNNAEKINLFDPFCPKILATRKPFQDKATESRCITRVMQGTTRQDIPLNLNSDFWRETESIRNKLLFWRFRNYHKISGDVLPEVDWGIDLEPRVKQIVTSFVSLFGHDAKQLEVFKGFIHKHQEALISERQDSFDGQIVGAIHSLVSQGIKDIAAADIVAEAGLTDLKGNPLKPRALSKSLRSLGFGEAKQRKVDGVNKRCLPLEEEHLNANFKRYGYDKIGNEVTEVTIVTESSDIKKIDDFGKDGANRYNRYNRYSVTEWDGKCLVWQPCMYPVDGGPCGDSPCNEFDALFYCKKHFQEAQK